MQNKNTKLFTTVLNSISLAMGVAVTALCIMQRGNVKDLLSMLAIAVICLSLKSIIKTKSNK